MTLKTERLDRRALGSLSIGWLSLVLLVLQTPVTEFAGTRLFDTVRVWLGNRSKH